jgi:hypothetical protein
MHHITSRENRILVPKAQSRSKIVSKLRSLRMISRMVITKILMLRYNSNKRKNKE